MAVILGFDPGIANLGFAIVDEFEGILNAVDYGTITTEAKELFLNRLQFVYERVLLIINKWNPDLLAIEKLFFNQNSKSAEYVYEARGVILLAAAQSGLPVVEYTPQQIKLAVTGYGTASKTDIRYAITNLFNLEEMIQNDTADAIAACVCYARDVVTRYDHYIKAG